MLRLRQIAERNTYWWARLYQPRIRLPGGDAAPFLPRLYEADLLAAYDAGGMTLVVKSRQLGVSTTSMVWAARVLCEVPGATVLVLSKRERDAKHILGMCALAYETAERPGKPKVVTDNVLEFAVEGGGRVIAETANQNSGRGFTGYALLFDEFAFLPWQEEMWRSAQPAVSATGRGFLVSTPNGQGDEFERLYGKHADPARVGASGEVSLPGAAWRVFRLPWQVDDSRDEAWRARQLESMTQRDFAQEHECSFLSSGEAVFRAEYLQAAVTRWAEVAGRAASRWSMGVDVAGEGRDETVITVLDSTAHPYATVEQTAWEHIGGPALQREIEERAARFHCEPALDYTGVGYGIAQNLTCRHRRVTFTGGATVSGDAQHQRVPRDILLSTAVQAFERGAVALNPEHRELLRALQTARWEKSRGEFVDRLDSWLLALWGASQQKTMPRWMLDGVK